MHEKASTRELHEVQTTSYDESQALAAAVHRPDPWPRDLLKECWKVDLTRAKESCSWQQVPTRVIMCRHLKVCIGSLAPHRKTVLQNRQDKTPKAYSEAIDHEMLYRTSSRCRTLKELL